jgi:hypothetical protein
VTHGRAYTGEVGKGEDAAFEGTRDERFQFACSCPGKMGDYTDLWKVEAGQHFNGDVQQGVCTVDGQTAVDQSPEERPCKKVLDGIGNNHDI